MKRVICDGCGTEIPYDGHTSDTNIVEQLQCEISSIVVPITIGKPFKTDDSTGRHQSVDVCNDCLVTGMKAMLDNMKKKKKSKEK